jgi:hypothetical protein
MRIVDKVVLSLQEKEVLYQLWNTEYPEKLSFQTIDCFVFNNLIKDKTLFTDRQLKSKGGHLLFLEMMKIGLRYV